MRNIVQDRDSGESSYYSITGQADKLAEPARWGAVSDGGKLIITRPTAWCGPFSMSGISYGKPESYLEGYDQDFKTASETPGNVEGLTRMKRSLESFSSAALADGNIDIAVKGFERVGAMDIQSWIEQIKDKVKAMQQSEDLKDKEKLEKASWAIEKYSL